MAVCTAEVTVAGETTSGAWRQTGTTGPNGDFEVPLPFATRGLIRVLAAKAGSAPKRRSTAVTSRRSSRRCPAGAGAGFRSTAPGISRHARRLPGESARPPLALRNHVPAHWEMEGFVAESGRACTAAAL